MSSAKGSAASAGDRAAAGRASRPGTPLGWLLIAVLLGLLCLRDADGLAAERMRQAAAPYAFNLVGWELRHVATELDQILPALRGARPEFDLDDASAIRGYFEASGAERASLQERAETAIERLVSDALRAEALSAPTPLAGGEEVLFPPVSFTLTEPPRVLIVSPRDRIEVSRYVLLRPDLDPRDVEQIEDGAAGRELSTLVTPIGGLATYPAMVLTGSSAQATLSSVAHEWVHAYFFFHPLGRGYWSDQEIRTINETAAELAGAELGRRLTRQVGLSGDEPPAPPDPRQSEFNRLMRETRREVDRLLATGQVNEAEAYMEQRRQQINSLGFRLRRLNQAYFAFHGSYAEGPAGSSPVAGQVRRLRNRSASLGEFLRAVAQVGSAEELGRLVP